MTDPRRRETVSEGYSAVTVSEWAPRMGSYPSGARTKNSQGTTSLLDSTFVRGASRVPYKQRYRTQKGLSPSSPWQGVIHRHYGSREVSSVVSWHIAANRRWRRGRENRSKNWRVLNSDEQRPVHVNIVVLKEVRPQRTERRRRGKRYRQLIVVAISRRPPTYLDNTPSQKGASRAKRRHFVILQRMDDPPDPVLGVGLLLWCHLVSRRVNSFYPLLNSSSRIVPIAAGIPNHPS